MNCLLGVPEPQTFKVVPSSARKINEADSITWALPVFVSLILRRVSVSELITFGLVRLVHQRWQHVTILDVEVVMGTENVGRDDCRVTMTILLEICPVNTVTKGFSVVPYVHLFCLSNTNEWRSELTGFPHFKQSLCSVCLSVFNYKLNSFNSPLFSFWQAQIELVQKTFCIKAEPELQQHTPVYPPVLYINHPFSMRVAIVGVMRWSIVYLQSVDSEQSWS